MKIRKGQYLYMTAEIYLVKFSGAKLTRLISMSPDQGKLCSCYEQTFDTAKLLERGPREVTQHDAEVLAGLLRCLRLAYTNEGYHAVAKAVHYHNACDRLVDVYFGAPIDFWKKRLQKEAEKLLLEVKEGTCRDTSKTIRSGEFKGWQHLYMGFATTRFQVDKETTLALLQDRGYDLGRITGVQVYVTDGQVYLKPPDSDD